MDIQMSTATETEANKRARKHNAVVLPEGITQQMMRQYVYYCSEYYDKSHTKKREYFRVDHPLLGRYWATTKSNKVSIKDKLTQANNVVDELEKEDEEKEEQECEI
jgi:dTDP-4-dehydrorhamnose 3,5-epimerase-like enzyme